MPALIFIIVLCIVLLLPIRSEVSVLFTVKKTELKICMGFMFGLIKIPFHKELKISKKRKRKGRFDAGKTYSLIESIRFDKVGVRGAVGIRCDAFSTVLAVGFIRIFTEQLNNVLLQADEFTVFIKPCFSTNVFWMYLEGIVTISPTQIIGIMVWKGRRKNATSD